MLQWLSCRGQGGSKHHTTYRQPKRAKLGGKRTVAVTRGGEDREGVKLVLYP